MKRLLFLLLIVPMFSFTNPVASTEHDWVYKLKPLNGITINFLRYASPCDGAVEASLYWGPNSVSWDRTVVLTIMWRSGSTNLGTVNYLSAPAGSTGMGVFLFTSSLNCSSEIISYTAGWYTM